MQLTLPIQIHPTLEQETVLWNLSEKCRLIYNFGLTERRDAYKNKSKISYIKQQNNLPKLKQTYPEYTWVYSKVLQGVLKCLDNDYKSFFNLKKNKDKKARSPGFKGKDYFTTMLYNQSGFEISDSNGHVVIHKSMETRIHSPTSDYTEQDKLYIDFSHKHPSEIPLKFELSAELLDKRIFKHAVTIDQINVY